MTGRPPRRRRRWRTRAGRKSRRISTFTPPFYWQTGVFRSRGGGEKKALSRNALKNQPPGITCQDKQDQYYFSLLISCGAFPVRHSFPGSKDASSPRATRHQKSSYRKLVFFLKKKGWQYLGCVKMHFWVNLHAGNYFKFPASRGQQEVKGEVLQGVPRRESHPPVFPKKYTKSLTLKRKHIALAPQGLPGEGPLRSVRRQLLPGGNVTSQNRKKFHGLKT